MCFVRSLTLSFEHTVLRYFRSDLPLSRAKTICKATFNYGCQALNYLNYRNGGTAFKMNTNRNLVGWSPPHYNDDKLKKQPVIKKSLLNSLNETKH